MDLCQFVATDETGRYLGPDEVNALRYGSPYRMVALLDAEGTLLEVSLGLAKLVGHTAEALRHHPLAQLLANPHTAAGLLHYAGTGQVPPTGPLWLKHRLGHTVHQPSKLIRLTHPGLLPRLLVLLAPRTGLRMLPASSRTTPLQEAPQATPRAHTPGAGAAPSA